MSTEGDKLDQLVQMMNDLRVQVEHIRTRLDEHVKHQDERTRQRDLSQAAIVAEAVGLRERVSALEKWRWTVIGASLGGATLVGGAAGKLAGLI